jgi:hypothetical protein
MPPTNTPKAKGRWRPALHEVCGDHARPLSSELHRWGRAVAIVCNAPTAVQVLDLLSRLPANAWILVWMCSFPALLGSMGHRSGRRPVEESGQPMLVGQRADCTCHSSVARRERPDKSRPYGGLAARDAMHASMRSAINERCERNS